MIFGLFGDKHEKEARQLNRDVPIIIEQAEQAMGPDRLRQMAEMTVKFIDRAYSQYGSAKIDIKRAHYDYRRLHKEARRNNDQVGLSAMTLVIIHLRAELAGVAANPAKAQIKRFTDSWLHDGEAQPADDADDTDSAEVTEDSRSN